MKLGDEKANLSPLENAVRQRADQVLAEVLGLPHATIIMQVEKQDGGIRVKRELDDGWFQHVDMPLPALVTIQSGINKLRYATLMGIKKAKSKEVKRLTAAELGVVPKASIRLERMYPPEKSKHTQMLEGTPKEAAAKLVEKLKRVRIGPLDLGPLKPGAFRYLTDEEVQKLKRAVARPASATA